MRILRKIHQLRQERGCKRQPSVEQALEQLDLVIKPATHPYKLQPPEMRKLMNDGWFKVGARGALAVLPASGYIYRVCPIAKLTAYSSGWFSSMPRRVDQPALIYGLWKRKIDELQRKLGRQPIWLPLRRYARGAFESPRKFSFWTGYELDPSDPIKLLDCAHSLGLPDDWLDEYSVVLRCETPALQSASLARVPTTLDGFDSPIFHPRREAVVPPSGITIDLSLVAPLRRGHDEFAVGPIDTASIHLYPIRIPQSQHPQIKWDDPQLLRSLRGYYRNLPV